MIKFPLQSQKLTEFIKDRGNIRKWEIRRIFSIFVGLEGKSILFEQSTGASVVPRLNGNILSSLVNLNFSPVELTGVELDFAQKSTCAPFKYFPLQ